MYEDCRIVTVLPSPIPVILYPASAGMRYSLDVKDTLIVIVNTLTFVSGIFTLKVPTGS